jgi:YaiO family outer membrane protein
MPSFRAALLLFAASGPATLRAQSAPSGGSWVEAGGFHHAVSNHFGDWNGGYARAVVAGAHNVWYLDFKAQEAFGDRGSYGSLANVHTFGRRVFTQVGIGAGSGKYVLPDLRADASISVKMGPAASVVLTTGGTFVDAKNGYSDRALFGQLAWYAASGVILEGGGRLNWSNPGAVGTSRVNGAVTLGHSGSTLAALSGSAGREGYQFLGVTSAIRKFRSEEAALVVRQRASKHFGVVLGGSWYHNPFYTRKGLSLGAFVGW